LISEKQIRVVLILIGQGTFMPFEASETLDFSSGDFGVVFPDHIGNLMEYYCLQLLKAEGKFLFHSILTKETKHCATETRTLKNKLHSSG
jgi:hypothetical protein